MRVLTVVNDIVYTVENRDAIFKCPLQFTPESNVIKTEKLVNVCLDKNHYDSLHKFIWHVHPTKRLRVRK